MNDLPLQYGRKTVRLVGVASGYGAADTRCAAGPDVVRRSTLTLRLRRRGLCVRWAGTIRPRSASHATERSAVHDVCVRLAERLPGIIARRELPVVIGGDHSCAIGTWKGIASATRVHGAIGLLWIDAHMDAHTPQTSRSGKLHGMPLACLLGQGHPELVAIAGGARLDAKHVCLFGVRIFEPEEKQLLDRAGVRVFYIDEIARRGVSDTLREALAVVSDAPGGFGITLDLDSIDPQDAPGVTTPAPNGLRGSDLVTALAEHGGEPRLLGLEITEYNPATDVDGKTAGIIERLIEAALTGVPSEPEPSLIALEQRYGARNYDPVPVVLVKGRGAYVWDDRGHRYIDMLSAYSAVSHGHVHPRLVAALKAQAARLAVTSRAYYNNRLPLFLQRVCEITGQDRTLPANTGLEAVEAALKAARKWGTKVKGIPADRVEILACRGNFHGRSIAILAMSTEAQYRDGFGPFPPGFRTIPYGNAEALEHAITEHTAAFLVEPIQGEGGIIVPPQGYLAECARICGERNVLLICDEVQTGLGRTGRMLACDHEAVRPDGIILGKALGGGLLPVSAFAARNEVMGVFAPGDHGSTFGGNPLAAAVGLEALAVLIEERLPQRAAELGDYALAQLKASRLPLVREVRGRGLLIGLEIDPSRASARAVCYRLRAHGVLTKDTHETVVRLAPPLVITRDTLDEALHAIRVALAEVADEPARHTTHA